jgi:hypothetical protein
MEYKCNICKKKYSGYQSLWIHNKKYHKTNDIDLPLHYNNLQVNDTVLPINDIPHETNINNKYNCKYCNKKFNFRQNKYEHEKICKKKIQILEEQKNIQLLEENKKLKEELDNIKTNNSTNLTSNEITPLTNNSTNTSLTNSHNTSLTNSQNNNTNNINNGTLNKNDGTINNNNNNTIIINQIGKEPFIFTERDIKSIARDGLNGPMTCVRKLNFNKHRPENHSYCSSSLEGQYCTAINHKTQKPEKIAKKELFDKVLESTFNFIESISMHIEIDKDLYSKISSDDRKQIQNILNNKNKFYEKKNWKTFFNSINSMSYNYKELILSSWKNLNKIDTHKITDTDSEYSEPDIKEVTEFYDTSDDEITDLAI